MGEPLREARVPDSVERGHEPSDVSIRPLAIFLATLAGALAAVSLALVALFDLLESSAEHRDPALPPMAQVDGGAPAPNLQVSPREDLEQFRQRESHALHSTEWLNRPAGVVRIPIDRAIELTVERGLPAWPAADVTATPAQAAAERPPVEPAAASPGGTGQSTPPTGGEQP